MLYPIDHLLVRLAHVNVKNSSVTGVNQWQALCPAHADKNPSLVITECSNGTVLVKCWAGCTVEEVVQSIGLELKDLFVHPSGKQGCSFSAINKLPSKKAIAHEQLIISIAEATLSKGHTLAPIDNKRYQQAKQRLSLIHREVTP